MIRDVSKGDVPILILAVLAEGPGHGYAIARSVEQRSKQALHLKEGSLYPALRILEQEGLILGEWEIQPSGPARKVYRITPGGLAELTTRRDEWQAYVNTMQLLMGRQGGEPDAQPS